MDPGPGPVSAKPCPHTEMLSAMKLEHERQLLGPVPDSLSVTAFAERVGYARAVSGQGYTRTSGPTRGANN